MRLENDTTGAGDGNRVEKNNPTWFFSVFFYLVLPEFLVLLVLF